MTLHERLQKILNTAQAYIDYEDAMLVQTFRVDQRLDTEPGVYGLYLYMQMGKKFSSRLLCSLDDPEQGEIIAENLNKSWRRVCDADKGM